MRRERHKHGDQERERETDGRIEDAGDRENPGEIQRTIYRWEDVMIRLFTVTR